MPKTTRRNSPGAPERNVSTRTLEEPPEIWEVVFLNDDVTTFDCVIEILVKVFDMRPSQAESFASIVHAVGWGIAGCYPKAQAAAKRDEAVGMAREMGYPLQIKIVRQS